MDGGKANQLPSMGRDGSSIFCSLLGADASSLDAYRHELRIGGHSGSLTAVPLLPPANCWCGALFDPAWAFGHVGVGHWPSSFNYWSDSLATTGTLSHLDALATDPLGPWDALICSSSAGEAVVQQLLQSRLQQLHLRFDFDYDAALCESPKLPVIPLPIDVSAIQASLPESDFARQKIGISQSAAVLLWIGRLSMFTKIDPWPQYQMLERLAKQLTCRSYDWLGPMIRSNKLIIFDLKAAPMLLLFSLALNTSY